MSRPPLTGKLYRQRMASEIYCPDIACQICLNETMVVPCPRKDRQYLGILHDQIRTAVRCSDLDRFKKLIRQPMIKAVDRLPTDIMHDGISRAYSLGTMFMLALDQEGYRIDSTDLRVSMFPYTDMQLFMVVLGIRKRTWLIDPKTKEEDLRELRYCIHSLREGTTDRRAFEKVIREL